jgi:hypothetical protein
VKFTLGQFIDAIEENGLPQEYGYTFRDNHDPAKGACAMGQAFWNLMGQPSTINSEEENTFFLELSRSNVMRDLLFRTGISLSSYIVNQNDSKHLPLSEIAANSRERFKGYLDREIVIYGISNSPATLDT